MPASSRGWRSLVPDKAELSGAVEKNKMQVLVDAKASFDIDSKSNC